jgi:hypothetical protein
MNKRFVLAAVLLTAVASAGGRVSARPQGRAHGVTVDAATRRRVIQSLLKTLNDGYVFPEVAKKMEADIRARVGRKEYDRIVSAEEFARKLSEDLQAVSRDKHLIVHHSPTRIPERASSGEMSAEEKESRRRSSTRMNHGFERVDRMEGNIGFINLREFADPGLGAETLAAAMNFVANTDALIIDLRDNMGGPPAMVALVCSYFFGSRPVHLNSLYWREGNRTEEFWTRPAVHGRRYESKDVFLLTSRHTFSAAEEFAYNLKHLKRATIVGETTGGAAHHGEARRLGDHFILYLPLARAINPITKTNWEGTGVKPDVEVPREQALKTAYLMALSRAMEREADADRRNAYQRLIEQQRKELGREKTNVP